MAIPTSRDSLKEYCLRELGAPVLEINVDDDQLEDRIDQSLEFWRLYHYDGIEKLYMKQKIRASEIILQQSNAATFKLEDIVTGQTSGATAKVSRENLRASTGTLLLVRNITGTFQVGETILAGGGQTATLVSATKREYDNKYIEIDDWVYGITRVLPFSQASSSKNLFDLQYQLRLNDLYDLSSTSIVYYKTVMSHLSLLDLELNGHTLYRFNRLQGRLYLDINWETDIPLGDHIVVEAYRALNPAEFTKVWNEQWLKKYVTAQFKRQWGTNLKKFSGIQLPGGVTLDGDKLYQEAMDEIQHLEDELQNKSAPLEFFLG
jgi:hypothetical protein